MRMKTLVFLAGALVLVGSAAVSQDDPIAARKALMKANNAAAKTAFGMASGRAPFDAGEAKKAMEAIASDMETFVTLFPEGSDSGDTSASPAIWSNMDDFKALAAELGTNATAAAAAADNGPGRLQGGDGCRRPELPVVPQEISHGVGVLPS